MPFSWEKEESEIYERYITTPLDPNLPEGLTRQQLLDEAERRCQDLGLGPPLKRKPNSDKYVYRKMPNISWSNYNEGFNESWNTYRTRRLNVDDWDKAFSLSDLNNALFRAEIPIEAIPRIKEVKRDAYALNILLTRRLCKWIARLDKIEPPINNCLTSTGVGLSYSLGVEDVPLVDGKKLPEGIGIYKREKKRFVWGILDIALMYSIAELKAFKKGNALLFDSKSLDATFMFDSPPEEAKVKIEAYLNNKELDELFRMINDKGSEIDSATARKIVKRHQDLKRYIFKETPNDGRRHWNINLKILASDMDLPTIVAKYQESIA